MSWSEWLSVLAVVVAIGALGLSTAAIRRGRALRRDGRPSAPGATASGHAEGTDEEPLPPVGTHGELVAFVANPTKPGASELRDAAIRACSSRYMPEPLWFETTVDDPGVGQAREAVARGAQAVIAVGGDGTVRAVAEALAGTGVPMGLIPQGTGNLLARNLDIALTDVDEQLRMALTGPERTIDVGWLRVVRDESQVSDDIAEAADEIPGAGGRPDDVGPGDVPPGAKEPPRDHIFLVIAGIGFDAAMVGDTDEELKAKVGWIAYFAAAARHLHGRRLKLRLRVDGGETQATRLRSLLIGNCGKLPGGINLLPDAVLDDGWLDLGAIDTRGGLMGWAQLFGEIVLQGVGIRNDLPGKIGRIDHRRAQHLHVSVDRPEAIQVDGDVLGKALEVTARVDAGALVVRTPTAA
ncbi:diacylglycerol kinase family protein [Cellulomonas fimi]|uniref:Diacylglycerol kinase n=1 Tax=Cellulomonas fimi TaxID=1708 RepID=A0A7Y0QI98_CELFI|nr:diacylglycerol kinase family protein [Cellulomonas fimi]NMR21120.1 diacylglycerol kinase [Cellulomonas fimi]